MDPCATYRRAVQDALPQARIVADHFHLVRLANDAVTRTRQRVTRDRLGRRGRRTDPAWGNRRRLLRARERLSERAFTRMWNELIDADPSGELLAAWIGKEELRALLATARRGGQRRLDQLRVGVPDERGVHHRPTDPVPGRGGAHRAVLVHRRTGGPAQPAGHPRPRRQLRDRLGERPARTPPLPAA